MGFKFAEILIILFLSVIVGNKVLGNDIEIVKTVENVDINRYMGTWFEISKIPNRFQKNCAGNTTAKYTLLDNGDINITNSCLENDGKTNIATGIARLADPDTNAKLKVSFFSIFGIHFFWGNYWILYLNEDYTIALIGEPNRKYGWILSRKTILKPEELAPVFMKLKENGYNPKDFEQTVQNITN